MPDMELLKVKVLLERAMTVIQYSDARNEDAQEVKDRLEADYQSYLESQEGGVWGLS